MTHPYFDVPRPTILGHRGAAGVAPENTLVSFERGLAAGAHVIETDAHGTRDGVPVLMHDDRVDRTTDGTGALADLDWADVRKLDAGHRFAPAEGGAPGYRGQAIRVPSLSEAFEAFPAARFNIEIKAPGRGLIERIVDLVRTHDREDRTLLVAGEDAIQAELRSVLAATGARPALGASVSDILEVVRAAVEGRAPTTDSMALQVPRAFGGSPLVTPELVAHCHAHDIAVHVWTINDVDEMRELLDLGVDGLVTDLPGRMARLLATRAEGTSADPAPSAPRG
jgi:glycerophosphoryl diester phosphodiesterase